MPRHVVKTTTPGNLWKIVVSEGDQVTVGDVLFIMEVMKMEVPHTAEVTGRVATVLVAEGTDGLDLDVPVVEIDPA